MKKLPSIIWLLSGGLFFVGAGQSVVFITIPPLARDLGLSEIQTGSIFASSALAWMLFSPYWGKLSDRIGRKIVVLVGLLGCALSLILFSSALTLGTSNILFGWKLLAVLILARMVNGILVLLLGVLLIDMPVHHPLATLGFIFLVSWAFSSMGLLLGQLADSWDQLAMMQNFFLTPLSFLGGIFYSIKMLPDWAQQLSLVNPIYYMINGLRYTVLGVYDSSPLNSFLMALFMTILFTTAAILLMKSGKKIKQ